MSKNPPPVSVVIPTFRRPDALRRTLRSLAAISYGGRYEVIVVDDGSEDSTARMVEQIQREEPRLHLRFYKQENSGAARARNRGAEMAKAEVLVFLDDDMLVEPDHLDKHVAHLSAPDAKRIINGEWEFAPDARRDLESSSFGRFRLWLEGWIKSSIEMKPLDSNLLRPSMLTACNLGIRRKDFLDLGGFDESFPAAGYEDQDLALRAARAGFEFVYDKRIVLAHLDQRTNLVDFSKRVRQGAFTAGIMAKKYPQEFASSPLIVENAPVSRRDGFGLAAKKFLKALAATKPGRAGTRASIWFLERAAPNSRLLRSAYWKWCGIWIHIGVREGLRFPSE